MTTTAIGTAILIAVFEPSLLCFAAGWLDAELDAALDITLKGAEAELEFCGVVVDVEERVGVLVLRGEASSDLVVVDDTDRRVVVFVVLVEVPTSSIVASGYGSREVVKLVEQQSTASGPPSPCPAAPAQHQLLAFASHRLTSVKP